MSSQPHEDLSSAPEYLGLATDFLSFLAGSGGLVDTGDIQPKKVNSRDTGFGRMRSGSVCNYCCKFLRQ
ncbi:hypothetical protein HO173_000609 [Letharia columbiana]|uniref:Uncharacterized protein n=1 Tax=Letharia columbiana TaxID=112416 RepID=A0A8H6G7E4_9LECA|nr:uncharacterized protein HO173_000609 [Letharia columbiana]KAF6241897.1 hypothetical protein HO173_000609 [Letharia columbiana]